MKVAVVTDSNSGISQEEAKEKGLYVLPTPFYIDDDIFRYYEDLYDIAKKYTIGEHYDLWLKDFREFIDDFKRIAIDKKICLVCGKEKDDYQSAYCDECWEEEKKRLGVD